jgi:hypothetical protein
LRRRRSGWFKVRGLLSAVGSHFLFSMRRADLLSGFSRWKRIASLIVS